MSEEVRSGHNGAGSQGWELLNPRHPLFPILFPKTATEAASGNGSHATTTKGALKELRNKTRGFLFSGFATSEVVDHVVQEVIVRMGMEQPLRRIDPQRGNGGGLFHTFLKRRVMKEVRRLQRNVSTIPLSDTAISAKEKDFDGNTPENRDLLKMVWIWLPTIPEKQALAVRRWLAIERREPGARESLTANDRVNLTRAVAALRNIARDKGLIV
jgi:DNA-directed RNA polymerase specialized sigma24 family protein